MPPRTSRRIHAAAEPTLSIDFGCGSSKMALAYMKNSESTPRVIRIPVGDVMSTTPKLELVASAALENDKLVVGDQALTMDTNIPLKTLLMFYAGITPEKIINRLPGGRTLMRAVRGMAIDSAMIADALCQHFKVLRHWASYSRVKLRARELFGDVRSVDRSITIVDVGSSTLNLQSVTAYFNADGEVTESQSSVPHGAVTGARGGSHVSNDIIRNRIERSLQRTIKSGSLAQGDIAALLLDFEQKKKGIDYSAKDLRMIYLQCSDPHKSVPLRAEDIQNAFETAFKDGLGLLRTELSRMLRLREDFGVLFCGGSFCNPGLHNVVKTIMAEAKAKGKKMGISVTHSFLRQELYWSSAVAVGAAVSMMRVPTTGSLLASSRIGIHKITRPLRGKALWEGLEYADTLWCEDISRPIDIEIPPGAGRWLKFFLVCDPDYVAHSVNADGDRSLPSRIRIEPNGESIDGGAVPYDLGLTIRPWDLPEGTVRFLIKDSLIHHQGSNAPVQLQLKCFRVTPTGAATKELKDKRYSILLKTDPVSKLLKVIEVKEQPLWCSRCKAELLEIDIDCLICEYSPRPK
ncbi:hypothetical protein EKO27_g2127 [Xylaria grammica]|uniref:Uncharacterized protein n=1 Tax=Xylaria grammica TaxID=363999 RepID=A0A439DF18_9PEZI|nr:hypothetical protein EKO27_g2127 [Xylaria grammica]